jgi:hypothetical protein
MLNNVVGLLNDGVIAPLNSYESISTVTVGSGSPTTVSFTSIPSTYTHLQIRALAAKGGTTDWGYMTLNSDTGANYSYHTLKGNGSSASAGAGSSQNYMLTVVCNQSATTFSTAVIDFLDYTNTNKNTTVRSLVGFDTNGGGEVYLTSGAWYNTAAVTGITFTTLSGTGFSQYSSFALYGIKG